MCIIYPGQTVFRLELLGKVKSVVDEGKASCFPTSKLCPEAKAENNICSCLVHATKLLSNLRLRNCGSPRM